MTKDVPEIVIVETVEGQSESDLCGICGDELLPGEVSICNDCRLLPVVELGGND